MDASDKIIIKMKGEKNFLPLENHDKNDDSINLNLDGEKIPVSW